MWPPLLLSASFALLGPATPWLSRSIHERRLAPLLQAAPQTHANLSLAAEVGELCEPPYASVEASGALSVMPEPQLTWLHSPELVMPLLIGCVLVIAVGVAVPAQAAVDNPVTIAAAASGLAPTTVAAAATASTASPAGMNDIVAKAAKRALGGGVSGALAGVAQVLTLMWLRTAMNYQYAADEKMSTMQALRSVYAEGGGTVQGGIKRLYRGLPFALIQTPISRFGDTAANSGVLLLLSDPSFLGGSAAALPVAARTAIASGAAALWRMGLTPIDTLKSTLQVRGEAAYDLLLAKVRAEGPGALFQGAFASAGASFVGSYPWFLTYNSLNERLPPAPEGDVPLKLLRSALLGLAASCVSDCTSNSLRVLKTKRQTSAESISYVEAAKQIIETDGPGGLFLRGLGTRLTVNALQAILFTVVWKQFEELIARGGLFGGMLVS